ncbi:MAG: rRNA processing protein RimM [Bacteroidota bacterium]|jgi:16S rRNA processing protein RimM
MDNYLSIGKLAATFGIKGELVLEHHLGEEASLEGIPAIFVEELEGKFLPYFISSIKRKSESEWLVGFEGVDTPEKAKRFVKKKAWLREADVKKNASASAPISLLGFTVYDRKKALGKVLEVIEQPLQILLMLEIDGKEVLVPVNESTIDRIDNKSEKIFLTLPEGLLDIYLN